MNVRRIDIDNLFLYGIMVKNFGRRDMNRTERLANKKYGLMVHYLEPLQNGKCSPNNPKGCITDWSTCVSEFDVDSFADRVRRTGAGYVIFSLCQVSAYMCAPSSVFDEITDYGCDGACSNRDLPLELARALSAHDIDLYLYFTGDGPRGDAVAAKAFGTLNLTGERVTADFVSKWAGVMRELAIRYGDIVKGWWIDGCFDYIGYNDDLLKLYKDAALAGNPDAIVAFNNGVVRLDMNDPGIVALADGETEMDKAIDVLDKKAWSGNISAREMLERYDTPKKYRYSAHEDFTAGESSYFNEIPAAGLIDGSRWHAMSFLGMPQYMPLCGVISGWCAPGCRYSAEYLKDYTSKVNSVHGVVTYDVCVDRYGSIDEGQIEVLSKIR